MTISNQCSARATIPDYDVTIDEAVGDAPDSLKGERNTEENLGCTQHGQNYADSEIWVPSGPSNTCKTCNCKVSISSKISCV